MILFRKYCKPISIFLLIAVVVSSFLLSVSVFNPSEVRACHDQGCNIFFWRSHTSLWVDHNPSDPLRILFSEADRYQLGDVTLLEALGLRWSFEHCTSAAVFAAKILLREGVAARLNVSHPDIDYHYSGTRVIQMVNDALASGNPLTMLRVARSLAGWNNAGCPFCSAP